MADPKHPRHYDEAFKRQIVQLYESGKPSRKIRRRGPDILRTIELGYSNARLEASDNRIKVTIRMAYGFHHVDNLIAPQERSNIPIEHCDTAMSLLKELSVAFNAFL